MSENSLFFIDENVFSNMSKLLQLELRDNDITSMHPNIFSGLNSMKLLDLSENKISDLRSSLFKDLSSLRELRLNDNTIKHLGTSTFVGLRRLDILHLENNGLEYIADNAVVSLELLRGLFLVSNNLTTITSCMFNGLRALTVLDVSFNQLTSIAEDSFTSSLGLTEVRLQNNHLKDINEDTFSLHTMLSRLDISNNRINKMIPFNFHRLNELNMLGNEIDCNCQQLSLAMSINAVKHISTCVRIYDDSAKYPPTQFLHMPSFVSGAVGVHWSNCTMLPSYSKDSKIRTCDYGVRIRTRKCVACSESHPPWCVKDVPSPRKRCVSFHAIKIHHNQSDICRLSGCPSRGVVLTRSNEKKPRKVVTQRCRHSPTINGGLTDDISPLMIVAIFCLRCCVGFFLHMLESAPINIHEMLLLECNCIRELLSKIRWWTDGVFHHIRERRQIDFAF